MYDLRGRIITFSIKITESGNIRSVSVQRGVGFEYDQTLEFAMKTHISFTPATKNGKRVEAQFYIVSDFRLFDLSTNYNHLPQYVLRRSLLAL